MLHYAPKKLTDMSGEAQELRRKIEDGCPDEPIQNMSASRHITGQAGTCPDMIEFYNGVLFRQGSRQDKYRKCTIISCSGIPVLAIKWEGDPSALGLAKVAKGDFNYNIMPGGVYVADKETISDAAYAYSVQVVKGGEKWAVLEVPFLRVLPRDSIWAYNNKSPDHYLAKIRELRDTLSAEAGL